MLNRTWSILAKGRTSTAEYGRRVDPAAYRFDLTYSDITDMLVPYGDELFRIFQIEQLTQLVLRSDLRDRMLADDPVNLYTRAPLVFPEPAATTTDAPVNITHTEDPSITADEQQGTQQVEVTVNPTSKTLVSGPTGIVSFTYNNLLSNRIEILPGRYIHLQGPLPGAPFTFCIDYVGRVSVDWPTLIRRIDRREYEWTDDTLREFFKQDINWVNRVSAVILLAAENTRRDT